MRVYILNIILPYFLIICLGNRRQATFEKFALNVLYSNYGKNFQNFSTQNCGRECLQEIDIPCFWFAYNKKRQECFLYPWYLRRDVISPSSEDDGTKAYQPKPIELARKKPTNQSSVFGDSASSLAVDGDINTHFHTYWNPPEWWCVDLLAVYNIRLIKVVNRISNGFVEQRLRGFELRLGTTNQCNAPGYQSSIPCYIHSGKALHHNEVTQCNTGTVTNIRARVLFVSLKSRYPLHFTEFWAYQ